MSWGRSKRIILISAGAIVMGLGAIFARFFLRPQPATLADLNFPVLVVREDGSAVFVETSGMGLRKMPMSSPRCPIGGTILIDSDFKMFTQQNIKAGRGETSTFFQALVRPTADMTYTFDLVRRRESGLAAARERVLKCDSLDYDKDEDARKRKALSTQTTMAGFIAVLESKSEE